MTVPTRYILAAFAFCAVALAHFIVPTEASACDNGGCNTRPPCHQGCNPNPPPPPSCCERPTVVVPPPNVPPPNVVIVNAGAHEGPSSHRAKVFANALAQARALMVGKSTDAVHAEMIAKGVSAKDAERLAPHRTFTGNRASTMMAIDALTPEALGALLAFYEHRTFAEAVFAGVNPFDQWGVELGKEMANALLPALEGGAPSDLDASTAAWVKRLG